MFEIEEKQVLVKDSKTPSGLDKRMLFTLGLIAILGILFWSQSRYPALNEKALMGGDTPLSGLSFETWFDVLPWHPKLLEIAFQTANWVKTNLKGMAFGVLFGAAALTHLSLGRTRISNSNMLNSAMGTLIGAPLGVCVNCAVPIAVGLHAGRAHLAMTLSAMIASPTLNIIVVSMAFALLPFEIAVIKLGTALFMTLVVIPVLISTVLKADATLPPSSFRAATSQTGFWAKQFARIRELLLPPVENATNLTALAAGAWVLKSYTRHLTYLAILTVPLMFVAAVLGAVMISYLDLSGLDQMLPSSGLRLVAAMIVLAVIASMAPVPIAFDVILTVALLSAGLSASYATVLLISLGSFSVYAMIVLWLLISKRTALWLMASVVVVAVGAGSIVHKIAPLRQLASQMENNRILASAPAGLFERAATTELGYPIGELRALLDAQRLTRTSVPIEASDTDATLFQLQTNAIQTANPPSETIFSRHLASDFGIEAEGTLTALLASTAGHFGGALAVGDLHADGWMDVVLTAPIDGTGLAIFTNVGGRFVKQAADLGPIDTAKVGAIALVDIVGDQKPDLIVTTAWDGNFLFENVDGAFSSTSMIRLPSESGAMSIAVGDLDQDNRLDIVLGSYTTTIYGAGWQGESPNAHNTVLWNDGDNHFTSQRLGGLAGQTLTSLIFDINQDGYPDYFHGDDTTATDGWHLFGPDRNVMSATPNNRIFPFTLITTMSYDVGDWNNDLQPDFYGAQISHGQGKVEREDWATVSSQICHEMFDGRTTSDHANCVTKLLELAEISSISDGSCETIPSLDLRVVCAAEAKSRQINDAWGVNSADALLEDCQQAFSTLPSFRKNCQGLTYKKPPVSEEYLAAKDQEVNGINPLFSRDKDGRFRDQARDAGLQRPGWSWNTLFADFDQNGRQDIMITTGKWDRLKVQRGDRVFLNDDDGFSDQTEKAGLSDMTPTWTYGLFDFDMDSDVDVITGPGSVTPAIYRNDAPMGRGLFVSLFQNNKNSHAIGARVYACTSDANDLDPAFCQVRWVKASGGYRSGQIPMAHFGIGDTVITALEVHWPDGNISRLTTPPLAGGHYVVTRAEVAP